MLKKINFEQIKVGIAAIGLAALWVYVLKCVYDDTPFLQRLSENFPTVFLIAFCLVLVSPLWVLERIEHGRNKR
jgi:hypothetical protein